MCRELTQVEEENILQEIVIVMVIEDCIETTNPLTEEDTLVEDPLMEEEAPDGGGPLDLLEVKDHQALKDLLGPCGQ